MKKLRVVLLFGIPLLLGAGGFLAAGESFLQSMFQAVQLFLFEFGDPPANWAIEAARWLSPAATASGIVMAVSAARKSLHDYMLYRKGNSVAVYGSEVEKRKLLKQLDGVGIDGGERFVSAHRYILLGNESENLRFYHRYHEQLQGRMVYLKCSSLPAQASASPYLKLFCMEEIAASLYWNQHCLYETSRAASHRMEIVLVGFDKLGEEVLVSALQNNVFDPAQQIAYHIFGDGRAFVGTHPGLHKVNAEVFFHNEPWYEQRELLERAARVIVLEQHEQLSLLRGLLLALKRESFHVFAAQPYGTEILADKERLLVFDWKALSLLPEYILEDVLIERAKRINMAYVKQTDDTGLFVESEENKQLEWEKLSAFHRYSNIRAADYHEIQRKMLEIEGVDTKFEEIPMGWKYRLSVLEHISWCNYHYLNNWEFGEKKDFVLRTHPDLILYDGLQADEKSKDFTNVEELFIC